MVARAGGPRPCRSTSGSAQERSAHVPRSRNQRIEIAPKGRRASRDPAMVSARTQFRGPRQNRVPVSKQEREAACSSSSSTRGRPSRATEGFFVPRRPGGAMCRYFLRAPRRRATSRASVVISFSFKQQIGERPFSAMETSRSLSALSSYAQIHPTWKLATRITS